MEEIIITPIKRKELDDLIQNSVRKVLVEHGMDHTIKDVQSNELPIDIKEASKIIGLSVPSIYGLVHRREIPVLKRRGKLLFFRHELIDWVRAGRRMTKEEIKQGAIDSLQKNR
jgi:excisionase family DNA binding protein